MDLGAHYLSEAIQTFRSMKKLADGAMAQLTSEQFHVMPDPESNSLETLILHMNGNMLSRWTDFLTTDGEKASRDRDAEFEPKLYSREELLVLWEQGWDAVFTTLESLTPDDLLHTVTIRDEGHTVLKAIQRQVSHYGYHVGQMVFLAKHLRSGEWTTLSIARGQSKAFRPDAVQSNKVK